MTTTSAEKRQERRMVVAATTGTAIEWYDYTLYAMGAALIFGPLFFSEDLEPAVATIASFATFAVGFIARPVGGLVLGQWGDGVGRKAVLIFCVSLIGAATFIIGLLPTYSQIGWLAPLVLVLLRLVQGFGAGVELAASLTLVTEGAKAKRRGLLTSIAFSGQFIGGFTATALLLLMSSVMPTEQFLSWGWRIPFLLSAVALAFALIVRVGVKESAEFEAIRATISQRKNPILEAWAESRRNLLAAFLVPVGQLVCTYIVGTYAISYFVGTLGMSVQFSLIFMLIIASTPLLFFPFIGSAVDKFGAIKVFSAGIALTVLFAFPFFFMLNTANAVLVVVAGIIMNSVAASLLLVPQGKFLPQLFPASHRLAGFAGAREMATAVFAGPTPFIASALVLLANGKPWLVAAFLVVAQLFTIVGLMVARPLQESMPVTELEVQNA